MSIRVQIKQLSVLLTKKLTEKKTCVGVQKLLPFLCFVSGHSVFVGVHSPHRPSGVSFFVSVGLVLVLLFSP